MVHQWIGSLWPPVSSTGLLAKCVACGGAGGAAMDFCKACITELPANAPACVRCALLLPTEGPSLCGACIKRLPRYESAFCPYLYGYPVDHLIRDLKYGEALSHGRILGTLLGESLRRRSQAIWPDCFVPVPLSTRRYRERGYNQVIEIGRFVERVTAVPMRTDLVKRVRHTEEQVGLSRKARRKNIRGAFEAAGDVPRRVAILDDVITTGSTVEEMARTLTRAGAAHVEVWALARAG